MVEHVTNLSPALESPVTCVSFEENAESRTNLNHDATAINDCVPMLHTLQLLFAFLEIPLPISSVEVSYDDDGHVFREVHGDRSKMRAHMAFSKRTPSAVPYPS